MDNKKPTSEETLRNTLDCGFALKRVRDMIRRYSQYNNNVGTMVAR